MHISDFEYTLPSELIAQRPSARRDESRLLVVHRASGKIEHRIFKDLPDYMNSSDVLVMNQTKVIKGRLYGRKVQGTADIEILLLRQITETEWECLLRPARRLSVGQSVQVHNTYNGMHIHATLMKEHKERSERILSFSIPLTNNVLHEIGSIPLPPYIERSSDVSDEDRYQTVYARHNGSVAAPTAGLHFSRQILSALDAQGVQQVLLTLHVSWGTFNPIRVSDIRNHQMHKEYYSIEPAACSCINERKGRTIVVGTTSFRVLETVADEHGIVHPHSGETDIYIYPGCTIKSVDALITNFHLPRSSLLVLVAAFMGPLWKEVYRIAVQERYRFFSYGDAMLII